MRVAALPAAGPVLVLAVVLAAALAGCGVPGSGVELVPASQVPPGLVEPAPPGGPPGSEEAGDDAGEGSGTTAALLAARVPSTYLLDDGDTLVAVALQRRQPAVDLAPPSPGAAVGDEEAGALADVLVRALNRGPTPGQRDLGLSTALGPGVPVRLVEVREGTAVLELRQPDRDPPADRLPLAVGQAVLTVTSAPGVDRVELLSQGRATAALLPDGAGSERPVTALDYVGLLDATR